MPGKKTLDVSRETVLSLPKWPLIALASTVVMTPSWDIQTNLHCSSSSIMTGTYLTDENYTTAMKFLGIQSTNKCITFQGIHTHNQGLTINKKKSMTRNCRLPTIFKLISIWIEQLLPCLIPFVSISFSFKILLCMFVIHIVRIVSISGECRY